MFDHNHYVPVLRWKRGESKALRDVGAEDRSLITPLIELAPKDFIDWRSKGPEFVFGELTKRVRHLPEVWAGRAAFIDAGLLDPAMRASGNEHPLEVAVDVAERHGSIPIPVLGLRRGEPYLNAVQRVASKGNGLALRVTYEGPHESNSTPGASRCLIEDAG